MIEMSLQQAASAIGARNLGEDIRFAGVSTDTRRLNQGELFCALSGPRFDGHDHCDEAAAKGAAAALVARHVATKLPQLEVADTRIALGALARAWRNEFDLPIVGVTGSNGKTTVKEMIAAILGINASVLATAGNLNNDIGVPLTLFGLSAEHAYAVIEMGANHVREIAELAALARPKVGVITLCAPVHLEGFGTIKGVARAKGEIYSSLAADGIAVINADDSFSGYWQGLARPRRIIRFGLNDPTADVRASSITSLGIGRGMSFSLDIESARYEVTLPLDGWHNVQNALAASAAALALDISPSQIQAGLERTRKAGGRLNVFRGHHGAKIIDDTYNASPSSLSAALDVLAAAQGPKYLILGDMGELGPNATAIHAQTAQDALDAGVTRLLTVGQLAASTSAAFGSGSAHFEDIDKLIESALEMLEENVTVLVKGSRFMRMERVSEQLRGGA